MKENAMREEALEPCPFCGSQPVLLDTTEPVEGAASGDYYHECKCGIVTNLYTTEAEAIAAWNRRASSPPPKGGEWWRDIESAPKDGTQILLCGPAVRGGLYMDVTAWPRNWSGKWPVVYMAYAAGDPTHWQPLPAAPDGKATPPDEMGAEQPKAASEHLSSENARLREALKAINRKLSNYALSFDDLMRASDHAVDIARAALSERTE